MTNEQLFTGVDTVDYALYPSRDAQMRWLRAYLEERNVLGGKSTSDVTESDVNTLYVQTNKCALVRYAVNLEAILFCRVDMATAPLCTYVPGFGFFGGVNFVSK